MLTPSEIRKRSIDFSREHADDHDEKSQAQNFWRDFFGIWGLSPQRIGVFESRARTLRGTVGFIDFFWPGTLLVEHKSRGRDLEAALNQALDYCSTGGLKDTELPRFIVVSDFARIRILELADSGSGERIDAEFALEELHERLHLFNFILGYKQRKYADEDPVNIQAAELMGALHDTLKANGYEGHALELFLVRLMFCFFADDTGIFTKDQFAFIMEEKAHDDGSDTGLWIAQAFQTINTAHEKRMKNLDESLSVLPYVNGGLFEETLPVPQFDAPMRTVFLHCCLFDWSRVSPAIFGSLFQSVMDAKARRNLGAHYTSEKNILKTIHGLFLDELTADFEKAKANVPKLRALLARLKAIRMLDPACGCGNFLILAYRELRLLEIAMHKEIQRIEKQKYIDLDLYRGIDVDAMYGIEIEEFPAQIARTALWIMDHLMNVRLSEEFGEYLPRLPLTTSPHIVHGNALRLDWKEIVRPEDLSYILGNPPFVGAKLLGDTQRADVEHAIGHVSNYGLLDFVAAWYIKAVDFMQNTHIQVAFVSTNSISQGEQVGVLWSYLLSRGAKINFAHRTFKWMNEAKGVAAVFCVIIGFDLHGLSEKTIHDYPDIKGEAVGRPARNINPYLVDSRDVIIPNRSKPICNVPIMGIGNKPIDGGNYLFTTDEKEAFLLAEPQAREFFSKWLGSDEFINGWCRWVLWLGDCPPQKLKSMPMCLERVDAVRKFRLASKSAPTRKIADTPTRFHVEKIPKSTFIVVPKVSSERRPFLPIGFMSPDVICSDLLQLITDASLFHFGIIQSTMHMSWMRQVCGRLKSDYRYSNSLVYNNFPWPRCTPAVTSRGGSGETSGGTPLDFRSEGETSPLDPHILAVEKAAQAVLDARTLFPDSSLADLYDPLTMPPALVKAHKSLDASVDKCYRTKPFGTELERVEFLFGLYEEYTAGLTAEVKGGKRGKKG
ncbi:MAG: class I SAM-dependent DNA methyltransferase [Spirochaetales bacterium]|nr:MAG: class I SAM-dependent DNA methyltransferase [Spirochaetales bacterium]